MTRDTDALIRRLAENIEPVRPLPHPCIRSAAWLGISVLYVAAIVLLMTPQRRPALVVSDQRFVIEQLFALAAGITAAVAAFASVMPGRGRKFLLLLVLPLAGWLGTLAEGSIRSWMIQAESQSLSAQQHLECFPSIFFLSLIPATAMAVMLRRGAPLTPRLTAALGGLAAAGLGNFCLRLAYPEDVNVMLLVWHLGAVLAVSALACAAGHYLLNWQSVIGASVGASKNASR
jgi:hypothetical protein